MITALIVGGGFIGKEVVHNGKEIATLKTEVKYLREDVEFLVMSTMDPTSGLQATVE